MNRFGFKWCWTTTRCKVYAASAATLKALEEGHRGAALRRRVLDLYELGLDMLDVAPLRCVICRRDATPNRDRGDRRRRLTLDHVIPLSSNRARPRGRKNLVAICGWCNSSRGARPLRVWLQNKHDEGAIPDSPTVVLHRVAVVRAAPVSRAVATAMADYFYPGFVRSQRGRWARRTTAAATAPVLPF